MVECHNCWAFTTWMNWGQRLYVPLPKNFLRIQADRRPKVLLESAPGISTVYIQAHSKLPGDAVEIIRAVLDEVGKELGVPHSVQNLSVQDAHTPTRLSVTLPASLSLEHLQRFTVRTMYALIREGFSPNNVLVKASSRPYLDD